MKIAYCPYKNETNKYIEISQEAIKKNGHEIYDFDALNFNKLKTMDAISLNWYESLFNKGFVRKLYFFTKKYILLSRCKKAGLKIYTTFHNKKAHDSKKIDGWFSKVLLTKILRLADKIIIVSHDSKQFLLEYLSEKDIEDKIFYIPHPNYIGVYSEPLEKIPYNSNNHFKVLFVGQVRKYKNVEMIIELAKYARENNYDIDFTIAGKCINETYKQEILKLAENTDNIVWKLEFIADEELEKLIRANDILLLPYNIESSMNSGTVILALSNSRSVICPDISTVKDFNISNMYIYHYKTETEHLEHVKIQLTKAYEEWKYHRESFEQKGAELFEEVKEKCSKEVLQKKYCELFDR